MIPSFDMPPLLLDTHVLVWLLENTRTLGRTTNRTIDEAERIKAVAASATTFWEIGMLTARNRLTLSRPVTEWRAKALEHGLTEFPLDGETLIAAAHLPDFHADPADRMIVATALRYGAYLVTADRTILAWALRHPVLRCLDATQ